jgi:hypothetical protein
VPERRHPGLWVNICHHANSTVQDVGLLVLKPLVAIVGHGERGWHAVKEGRWGTWAVVLFSKLLGCLARLSAYRCDVVTQKRLSSSQNDGRSNPFHLRLAGQMPCTGSIRRA